MMMKEPEIKLFGRKIIFAGGELSGESSAESNNGSGGGTDCDRCSEVSGVKQEEEKQDQADYDEDQETGEISETTEKDEEQKPEKLNNNNLSESDNNPKTPSTDDGDVASTNQTEQQTDPPQNEQQQKTLKKPDKILPCPRCNSMDTKFCYYNNYNINQPRHFCKSCQRYWTAGGTMRNVPVGAGRRKNKNSGSHCRHITISEALQAARIDPSPNGFHHMKFKPNGTVLSFGPDSSPLCDSLNLAEKGALDGINGFYKIENRGSICKNGLENVGDRQKPVIQNAQNGLQSPVPCIPGVPWSFPWNPTVPIPAVYPMPYYPAPYAWNMPWLTVPFPKNNQKSNPGSPLGKHSRNGELITPNRSEEREEHKNSDSSIVVPKTLRIDDPEEAAKSSIWATLGIKYGSISREGLFKALQPKADEKKQMVNTSPLLQANPAALSRSISFRERA